MLYESYGGRIGAQGSSFADSRARDVAMARGRADIAREQWMAPPPAYDFELERGYYE
jgi:hypothetical protein